MSTTVAFDESKFSRDDGGRFDKKPQSAPEAVLKPAGPPPQEPEALFPADWTDDDFPAPASESHEAIDIFFARPEPDIARLDADADINILDPDTWGQSPF